jgi:predicted metal-dependent phosphoesterase TrpH
MLLAACQTAQVTTGSVTTADSWWRGNTHTHTLWSDGDDFPEAVAEWYKQNGYQFLAITDHNTLAAEERSFRVPPQGEGREAYTKYRERFGAEWVEERLAGDTLMVRLRRFPEYRGRVEQPGRFILVAGEEITQYLKGRGAHMNALNLADPVSEQRGASLIEIFQKDLDSLRAQEQRSSREIVAVLNHPNFIWSQTAEDLLELPDLRLFEVYNAIHSSTSSATRFTQAPMERGDFYASTGVTLSDLRRDGSRLSVAVRAEPGVSYTIQFIGTRRGYDTASVAVRDSAGVPVTRRYSSDVGKMLAEMRGPAATYTMQGDEIYVRARLTSSKVRANPSYPGEVEMAWTQPVRP